MSLWDRLHRNAPRTEAENLARRAQQALAAGVEPRESEAVSECLADLWNGQAAALGAIDKAIIFRFLEGLNLLGWLPKYVLSVCPNDPAAPALRFQAVVKALDKAIGERQTELTSGASDNFEEPFSILTQAVHIVRRLRVWELQELCCDLLFQTDRAIVQARQRTRAEILADLRETLYLTLLALPPDRIPAFWARLKAPETCAEFWPVAARMQDKDAVPFLLDALPILPEDGQSALIAALRRIGDARAIPALQRIAGDPDSLLAPIAASALTEIMRRSGQDAAQLLRPSMAQARPNELLRAAGPTPDTNVRPDELLRADNAPKREKPTP